jgi:hypothetical protein
MPLPPANRGKDGLWARQIAFDNPSTDITLGAVEAACN